jgi:hypothetical protein
VAGRLSSGWKVPADPPIFHITHVDNLITHVDNLAGIVREGGIWCDAQRLARALGHANIGYRHIKQRRRARPVMTRTGGTLGDYVPFNFCPRSVMLYAVHRGHQDYDGGQERIVHLVSSVRLAVGLGRPWAFTDRHADLSHAMHFDDLQPMAAVPWHVMGLRYWLEVKEERQAEFLVHQFFPWTAVRGVALMTRAIAAQVQQVIEKAAHRPPVTIEPGWCY